MIVIRGFFGFFGFSTLTLSLLLLLRLIPYDLELAEIEI